jgi:hypothetical protein
MRTLLIAAISIMLSSLSPLFASSERDDNSLIVLKKEVTRLFHSNSITYPDIPDQDVTVGFLINARNELIILDVTGNSNSACEYVKQVLNYNRVKFNQEKQLTRYSLTIHLINERE